MFGGCIDMNQETYFYFLDLINEKIKNYNNDDLFSFYKNNNNDFKFLISFVYFLILKEYLIKKAKHETEFSKKYSSNLFDGDLEEFIKLNNNLINIESIQYNDEIFVIDAIRDSLLHGLFEFDYDNKKIILNNEMKEFIATLDFDFFIEFLNFEFGRLYKVEKESVILPISDYNFYHNNMNKFEVTFEDIIFLNIRITSNESISNHFLWNLKCDINDLLGYISKYINNQFDYKNFEFIVKIIQNEIKKSYPYIDIQIEQIDNKIIETELNKYEKNPEEIKKLKDHALCQTIDSLLLYHFNKSTKKILSCLHDIFISLNKFDEIIYVENDKITQEIIQLILTNNYDYNKTMHYIRKKYNLISDENYDFIYLKFNQDAEMVRLLKKYKKEGLISKKKMFEGLNIFTKLRDEKYKNDIFVIESQDEYIIRKYINENNIRINDEIKLKDLKKIDIKLYNKYKNKFLINNIQSQNDYDFQYEIYKRESIKWALRIKSRTYYYDDTFLMMFLYLMGLGLYATNKDKINLETIVTDNIKCYSIPSYKEFKSNEENIVNKLMIQVTLESNPLALAFISQSKITETMCVACVEKNPLAIRFVPYEYLNCEMCNNAFNRNDKIFKYIPDEYKTMDMCLQIVNSGEFSYYDSQHISFYDFPQDIRNNLSLLEIITERDGTSRLLDWNERVVKENDLDKENRVEPLCEEAIIYLIKKREANIRRYQEKQEQSSLGGKMYELATMDSKLLMSPLDTSNVSNLPIGYEDERVLHNFSVEENNSKTFYYVTDIHLEHQLENVVECAVKEKKLIVQEVIQFMNQKIYFLIEL